MEEQEQCNIHSICRICLEYLQIDNAYDLFIEPGLAKKLCICTSLSVEPQDGFPKNICRVCYTRLNDLHDFQRQCVDSVRKFQEMITNKTLNNVNKTDKLNQTISTELMHVDTFDILTSNTVNLESDILSNPPHTDDDQLNFDPLLNHKLELIENEDEVFKMLEHVDKEVKEEEEKNGANKLDDSPLFGDKRNGFISKSFFNCDSSSESKNDNDDIQTSIPINDQTDSDDNDEIPLSMRLRRSTRRKVKSSQNKSIKAKKGASSDAKEDYDDNDDDDDDANDENDENDNNGNHATDNADDDDDDDDTDIDLGKPKTRRRRRAASDRNSQKVIECHICDKKFKKVERYNNHMKYHNDRLPYQCSVESCLKGFTTANGLRLHIEHCHAETIESFPCPEEGCGRTFPRTRLLNWHLKKVHRIAKELNEPKCYPCSECEKVFRCPMALKKHMYKHDGKELPFPCNICGKRFVINSALKDHLMRHAGIKNYVCPYCGVGKTTRQEWNTHMNTHTQEKKYKCHLCPHASHNKQNLRMHVKIVHEKIKDYACQYCGKTFGKSNACKMHEMTHTGEKRCECKVCGKRFLYAKGLTKHLKTHEKRVLRAIEVYRKRQIEIGEISSDQPLPPLPQLPEPSNHSKETHQKVAEQILKVCAESAATIPKDPRRVERVDIAELAGTPVNPIPSVAVPSWSPQINFMMKEGPHICPDCGQGFNGPGNLKRHHRIVHEGVKDFACRFCHRRFAKAQTLKHHEMTHTGEKPHECKTCGKRFIQYVALKRHMKVHMKVHPRMPEIPASVYVAHEELQLQERQKMEAKRKAEEERAAIAEAAKEQLNEMQLQHDELQKIQEDYIANAIQKAKSDSDADTGGLVEFTHVNTSTMGIRTRSVNDN